MRLSVFALALSLALPAGSVQGRMASVSLELPPADLSYIPAEYRHDISLAASVCGVPVRILTGVAFAESSFRPDPAHPDPLDRGMFGLHESAEIRAERVAKYGEYDPLNPGTAAIVAARILAEHRANFGDWSLAIAAYRQGASGVRREGVEWWYVERVRGTFLPDLNSTGLSVTGVPEFSPPMNSATWQTSWRYSAR